MDDERIKERDGGGYFDELLARIRDIRSSERVFWRKVLDRYATSVDYDPWGRGLTGIVLGDFTSTDISKMLSRR